MLSMNLETVVVKTEPLAFFQTGLQIAFIAFLKRVSTVPYHRFTDNS
jgi:hypothetical protein